MTKLQRRFDRLEQLTKPFPIKGRKFYFGCFVDVCNTLGCLLGEAPSRWPRQWKMLAREPRLRKLADDPHWDKTVVSAQQFFGISQTAVKHLFFPMLQNCDRYGGKTLWSNSKRREVVANLRKFIKLAKERCKTEADLASF